MCLSTVYKNEKTPENEILKNVMTITCENGFVTLTDHVEFLYKADNYYAPEADGGIRWNDPELAIEWGIENPILSQKDQNSPWLKDAETGF